MIYTKRELQKMLRQMQSASNAFYSSAVSIGCHPFIEFAGLMNEYIKLCQTAYDFDADFTQASAHSGGTLPLEGYHAAYLAEKFDCIFGPSLRRDPKIMEEFTKKLCLATDAHGVAANCKEGG